VPFNIPTTSVVPDMLMWRAINKTISPFRATDTRAFTLQSDRYSNLTRLKQDDSLEKSPRRDRGTLFCIFRGRSA